MKHFATLLLLAVGLAMDATAVSAAKGLAVPRIKPRHVVLVAGFFGGFQALMPLIGYFVGQSVGAFVSTFGHWIAFALLAGIGVKMIWEAREPSDDPPESRELFGVRVMFVLGIATSIDAFAAGVTLPLLGAPLFLSAATIGATTAVSSALGLFAGRRFGSALGRRLDTAGGLVLIGLGIKAVLDHHLR
jgi:putative Mn2+ efflux pump MntP